MDNFRVWVARRVNQIEPCNCGGPMDGTGHSPDCASVLSMDNLWDEYKDEEYQEKIALEEICA